LLFQFLGGLLTLHLVTQHIPANSMTTNHSPQYCTAAKMILHQLNPNDNAETIAGGNVPQSQPLSRATPTPMTPTAPHWPHQFYTDTSSNTGTLA
jgi:hypothetical protein